MIKQSFSEINLETSPIIYNYLAANVPHTHNYCIPGVEKEILIDTRILALVAHYLGCEKIEPLSLKYISLRDYLKISVRDIITVTFEESDPLTTTVVNLIPYTLETGINSKKLVTPLKEVDTPSDGFNSDLFLSSSEIEDDTSEDENYLPQ